MPCDVRSIIERESGQPVTDETTIESLGLDSLEVLDLMLTLGDAAGKEIPDSAILDLSTVGEISAFLGAQ